MNRILLGAAFGLLLSASSSPAQYSAGVPGSFGGGYPPSPRSSFAPPFQHTAFPGAASMYRPYGFNPYYSYYAPYYFGGGFIPYQSYAPSFALPASRPYFDDSMPLPVPRQAPPQRVVQLSGELPATLTLEFPAPAAVWLNDREVPGKPDSVRVLTSPDIRPGTQYTFHVRARWESNGKTWEYSRDAALGPGDRSKLLVVSGTVVNDRK